jgi:hypothetical protein
MNYVVIKNILISVTKNNTPKLIYDDKEINLDSIKQTPNFSFEIEEDLIKYFNGQLLSNYMKCSSGMTTGKNEYFVRKINQIIINKESKTGDIYIYYENKNILGSLCKRQGT